MDGWMDGWMDNGWMNGWMMGGYAISFVLVKSDWRFIFIFKLKENVKSKHANKTENRTWKSEVSLKGSNRAYHDVNGRLDSFSFLEFESLSKGSGVFKSSRSVVGRATINDYFHNRLICRLSLSLLILSQQQPKTQWLHFYYHQSYKKAANPHI